MNGMIRDRHPVESFPRFRFLISPWTWRPEALGGLAIIFGKR